MREDNNTRFQILSLDGGGIKGIFSAALLAAIEEDLNTNIVDHFDLIAGTSTGGIIALGLGVGMKPRQILEFYLSEGPNIFPHWYGIKRIQQWGYRKFSSDPLMTALKGCFSEKKLSDSKKRIVIPSYNLGEDDVYVFRTPHHEKLRNDYKVPVWKIALATTAAPTYFPCSRHLNNLRLIDGGVWANNPTMVALVEAYNTLKIPLEATWIMNIGTSDAVTHRRKRLNTGGILAWAIGNAAIDIIMRGQGLAATNQAKLLLGNERFIQINPKVAAAEFSLDGINKADDLIGKAAHYSRIYMPLIKKSICNHKALDYVPIYPKAETEANAKFS